MSAARLAEFAATLDLRHVPPPLQERLALLTFDLCATALFVARRTPWGRIVTALVTEDLRGPAVAAVLGTPRRTSPPAAALANGTLAMGFEYEDTHPLGGHPFSIAFPAALAVGQWRHLPASEVLTAAAAGYEVEIRLRRAARMTSPWPDRGLYPVTLFGVFGAAAAAGRAAGLSPAQMVQALGIAGSHAFGTMQAHAEGTMTRRLHGGKAAEVGVLAALLARRGFTGPAGILDGEYGFFRTFAGTEPDLQAATADLGQTWALADAWLKRYAVNGLFQAAIEALQVLQAEQGVAAEEVTRVEATIGRASRLHAERDASSVVRAQFSLPVVLALTLRYGAPHPDVLLGERFDTDLVRLAERVTVTFGDPPPADPDARRFGRVEVWRRDGSRCSAEVLYPRGHPRNPMGWEDIRRKYDELLSDLPPDRRRRLAARAAGFPGLGDSATFRLPLPQGGDG